MKIVSACLAGIGCRYDGEGKPCQDVIDLVKKGEAIPLCPEQLGGLATPRSPAEWMNGRVVTQDGRDVTEQYEWGAQEALKIALMAGCDDAILKTKSPTCGLGRIYDGSFSGELVGGDGCFTRLLKEHGVRVRTETDL